MGVTRIFEKIEEGIKTQQGEVSGLRRLVLEWARRQALHHHTQEEAGSPHTSLGYSLARRLVFSKVTPRRARQPASVTLRRSTPRSASVSARTTAS